MTAKLAIRGTLAIPPSIVEYCDTIKHDNYKTNTPKKFQKHQQNSNDAAMLMAELAATVKEDFNKLDFVFFSVCKGAEEHTDILPQEIFHDTTYVIPVILPKGKSVITAQDEKAEVSVGMICQFDHTKPHSMILEDVESGCVVIMVAVKHYG